jgi:predicted nuclease of predicted toxin-antitoxin system
MKIWINGQLPPRLVKLDKDNKYDGTLAYLFGTIWET